MAEPAQATEIPKAEGELQVPAVTPVTTPVIPNIHDAAHQTRLLREALQSDKVRIGYFIGAGCPLGIYDEKGEKSLGHIPDVAGLTKNVRQKLGGVRQRKLFERNTCATLGQALLGVHGWSHYHTERRAHTE